MVSFTIPGDPMGKQRARVLKSGISYTPGKTVNYETFIKEIYTFNKLPYLRGAIEMRVIVYMMIPKSTSKKKRDLMLQGKIRPTKKPDWDNIGKIISDSLNGIAYDDDKQIVDSHVIKLFGEEPRVEVEISEV